MASVTTEKELAAAIKSNESTITISGDLAKKTFKIHATGSVAWAVVTGGLIIAAGATFVTMGSGGTAAPAAVPAATVGLAASSIMGVSATTSAISIILASGGVATGMTTLKSLRKYKVAQKSEGLLVLNRR